MGLRRRHVVLAAVAFATATNTPNQAVAVPSPEPPKQVEVVQISRIKTDDPVVFITIDDGFAQTSEAAKEINDWGWPVTTFAIGRVLRTSSNYFMTLGPHPTFGNHTSTHAVLTHLDLEAQRAEICGGAKAVEEYSGTPTKYFRPPTGASNADTYIAAQSCGMRYLLLWRATVNGTRIDTWGKSPLHKGDIILLHYRPDLAASLLAVKTQLDLLGLVPAPLDWYLPLVNHPPIVVPPPKTAQMPASGRFNAHRSCIGAKHRPYSRTQTCAW